MILWLIVPITCYVLGDLHGQGKFKWKSLGGAAGKARDAVFGLRPASNVTEREHLSQKRAKQAAMLPSGNASEVSPTPPKNPIRAGQALKNILAFFGGLLAWMAKNPVVAIGLVLLACLLVFGLPFGLGKSKGELRLEREIAEANARVAEHEARLGEIARDLAVNTERDRTRRTQVIAQAEQEIENAAAEVDPSALSDAYESRYLCVLDPSTCAGGANPAPSRSPPVRGARTDPA